MDADPERSRSGCHSVADPLLCGLCGSNVGAANELEDALDESSSMVAAGATFTSTEGGRGPRVASRHEVRITKKIMPRSVGETSHISVSDRPPLQVLLPQPG